MTQHSNAAHIAALLDLRQGVAMDRHNLDDGDAKLAAIDAAVVALFRDIGSQACADTPDLSHIKRLISTYGYANRHPEDADSIARAYSALIDAIRSFARPQSSEDGGLNG